MVKIAMTSVVGILLALQLRSVKPEYAVYLCLGVSLLICLEVTEKLGVLMEGMELIQSYLPLQAGYLKILMKMVGITYIAEFAADFCKDAGYQTIAGQIQIFGKLSVLAVSLPVMAALLDTIHTFLAL